MYGKEYIDWLENVGQELVAKPFTLHLTKCPALVRGGHELEFHTDGHFSGYKCLNCGSMMGEMTRGAV